MDTEPIAPDATERVTSTLGATLSGLEALPVEVEVRLLRGILGTVKLLGLREVEARESRERVRSAIRSSGLRFPERSLLFNVAPAELRKVGPGLDLPIAAAVLAISEQVPAQALAGTLCWGELALDGRLRPLRGALPVALLARQRGVRRLVVPRECVAEVARVRDLPCVGVGDLSQLADLLHGREVEDEPPAAPRPPAELSSEWNAIQGQDEAKEAVLTAAVGGHHLLLNGPPGSGKSMLARSLVSLLPDLDEDRALEVSCIHSAAGLVARVDTRRPPFRAPHCSVSIGGLAGGGAIPRPGEMTLAHAGVLFLDELPHLKREVTDLLRGPLEEGRLVLSRAGRSIELPARFQLIAAMNPCPCGFAGELHAACSCSPTVVQRYRARIPGPVLDRLDLSVRVPFVPAEQRRPSAEGLQLDVVRERVARIRQRQLERNVGVLNGRLCASRLERAADLAPGAAAWLDRRIDRLRLSIRAHHRVLRVARTLADLAERGSVEKVDLARALALREPEASA